jgi:hypothetical protein
MYGSMIYIVLSLGGVSGGGGFHHHFGDTEAHLAGIIMHSLVFYLFFLLNLSHLESISPSHLIFEFRRFITAISSTQCPDTCWASISYNGYRALLFRTKIPTIDLIYFS